MQTSYTVTIRKEHCKGEYSDIFNCPLCIAIREQLPGFNLSKVGAFGFLYSDLEKTTWRFNNEPKDGGWCHSRMRQLLSGEISEYKLTFWLDGHELKKPEVKERIKYVAVPETIKESVPENSMS